VDRNKKVEIVNYNPWQTGFGWRLIWKYGIVLNTSGNQGQLLHLKNGKKRIIGTARMS
jgi:hypothetical protein